MRPSAAEEEAVSPRPAVLGPLVLAACAPPGETARGVARHVYGRATPRALLCARSFLHRFAKRGLLRREDGDRWVATGAAPVST